MQDNHSQFSGVVENYRRYRPHYPHEILDLLRVECGLTPGQIIADIGSGTGLLTELLLNNGNRVYGVEPNLEMRSAAEALLSAYPLFTSVAGTAEATTLANHSVHMITSGQAFHWFNHELALPEFLRIINPHGWVVLIWNLERNGGSEFATAFEQFWRKYIDPRKSFDSDRQRPDYVTRFFGRGNVTEKGLENYQVCDFETLKGRVLSSSKSPQADDPSYSAMLDELSGIFTHYQEHGTVTLEYDTRVVYGQLSA